MDKNEEPMVTVELFSGTGSFSKVALERGNWINTYDLADHADELVEGTHTRCDVLDESVVYHQQPDILWASPPCTAFSVASLGHHWTGGKGAYIPKTEAAVVALKILERTLDIIVAQNPDFWFIENPRGMMRKKIDKLFEARGLRAIRHTVTYCQYGDDRMKPTDIWTNCDVWKPKPACKNGAPCHVAAPRGSKTGTQGIKGARERSRIPAEIFHEILDHLDNPPTEEGLFTYETLLADIGDPFEGLMPDDRW